MTFSQSRTIAKALLLAAVMAGAPACDVLTQDPPTAFSLGDMFSSAANITKSLAGVYNNLQEAEFLGGRALIYSDIRSGDTDAATYFGTVGRFQMLSTETFAANAWYGGYRSIFAANSFMQNLAQNTGKVSPELEKQYIAECKFIRALTMWHLVNLFAQPYNFTADASHPGIVVQTTAPASASEAFDPSTRLPRASVKEVYAQMEKDLREAFPDLPAAGATRGIDNVGRATSGAAKALLARIFLYKGDYAQAADFAGQVISSGTYALNASPRDAFYNYTTKESLFSVAMTPTDNPNTNNAIGQHYGPDRRADITVNPYAASTSLSATDKRRTTLLDVRSSTNTFTAKYYSVENWIPIVRYPEVLLTRAEALAQTSATPSVEAITLLNQVRTRSTTAIDPLAVATKASLIDAILEERHLELAFEGFRLYDLLRYKRDIPAHGTIAKVPFNDPRVIFPIPDQQVRLNPSLVQNTGY